MLKIHSLKISPEYYDSVITRCKTAELCLNDRDYRVGDLLKFKEYCVGDYLGSYAVVRITDISDGFEGLEKGYVMLSFEFLYEAED